MQTLEKIACDSCELTWLEWNGPIIEHSLTLYDPAQKKRVVFTKKTFCSEECRADYLIEAKGCQCSDHCYC